MHTNEREKRRKEAAKKKETRDIRYQSSLRKIQLNIKYQCDFIEVKTTYQELYIPVWLRFRFS